MFASEYLYVQILQFFLLCLVVLGAYATYKSRTLSFLVIYCAAIWFLVSKIIEYVISRRLPMDISALCYFLYGVCAFLPVRPFKVAAAQLSGICGLTYGLVMFAVPQFFFMREMNELSRYLAIINHMLLFLGGLAMIGHVPFKKTDFLWTLIFLTAIIVYIEMCVAKGVAEGNAVFSKILDGSVILIVAPDFSMSWWYYALYYPLVLALFGLWIKGTYVLNRRVVQTQKKAGIFAL